MHLGSRCTYSSSEAGVIITAFLLIIQNSIVLERRRLNFSLYRLNSDYVLLSALGIDRFLLDFLALKFLAIKHDHVSLDLFITIYSARA
jgi:hypothetical protein